MSKNYPSLNALTPVERLLAEVATVLSDPDRTEKSSGISDILGAAFGTAAGIGASAAWISAAAASGTAGAAALTSGLAGVGAVVGGGMMAGLAVAAAPVAVLAVGGYALVNRRNQARLRQRQQLLLQEAIKKHQQLIARLQANGQHNQERVEYLSKLVILLEDAIRRMTEDQGGAAAPA